METCPLLHLHRTPFISSPLNISSQWTSKLLSSFFLSHTATLGCLFLWWSCPGVRAVLRLIKCTSLFKIFLSSCSTRQTTSTYNFLILSVVIHCNLRYEWSWYGPVTVQNIFWQDGIINVVLKTSVSTLLLVSWSNLLLTNSMSCLGRTASNFHQLYCTIGVAVPYYGYLLRVLRCGAMQLFGVKEICQNCYAREAPQHPPRFKDVWQKRLTARS